MESSNKYIVVYWKQTLDNYDPCGRSSNDVLDVKFKDKDAALNYVNGLKHNPSVKKIYIKEIIESKILEWER